MLVEEVLAKCDALRSSGYWPSETILKPRRWLQNFDAEDQATAAFLLDRFTYYKNDMTERLFISAYNSICDGLHDHLAKINIDHILASLETAVFVPVEGEEPNVTDSGFIFCRAARQRLKISSDRFLHTKDAVKQAASGRTIIFVDDFIGSGDQFLKTWTRHYGRDGSFDTVYKKKPFEAIYIPLVSTDYGLSCIRKHAPNVHVTPTHVLGKKSTLDGIKMRPEMRQSIDHFLDKYSSRLTPKEEYIAQSPLYKKYGYKDRRLLLAFEHSTPDATLPVFWSPGIDNWEPLVERS